jgi:hypothetical protein
MEEKKTGKKKFYLHDGDITLVDVDDLARELLEWAHKENSLVLRQFVAQKGYSENTFFRWMDKNEKLREAYNIARSLVGCHREHCALYGTIKERIFLQYQSFYDPEYKRIVEWEASLRQPEQTQASGPTTIIMQPFPSDDRVPPRKEAVGFPVKTVPISGESNGRTKATRKSSKPKLRSKRLPDPGPRCPRE